MDDISVIFVDIARIDADIVHNVKMTDSTVRYYDDDVNNILEYAADAHMYLCKNKYCCNIRSY
jgi:hypothetical protein